MAVHLGRLTLTGSRHPGYARELRIARLRREELLAETSRFPHFSASDYLSHWFEFRQDVYLGHEHECSDSLALTS